MLQYIDGLESLNVIEYMDGNEDNRYYRFVNPGIREIFY